MKRTAPKRPTTVRAVLGGGFPHFREDAKAWSALIGELTDAAIEQHPDYRPAEIRGFLLATDITEIRRQLGRRWQPGVINICATLLRAVFSARELPVIAIQQIENQPMNMSPRTDRAESTKGHQTYYSLTLWQRGDWLIEVHYGHFASEDDADDFSGCRELELGFNQYLWLHHPYGVELIPHEDVKIFRRVQQVDLNQTTYGIEDLARYIDVADMRCIAQSHGIHQHAKENPNVVEIDFGEFALELGEAMPANDEAIGVSKVG